MHRLPEECIAEIGSLTSQVLLAKEYVAGTSSLGKYNTDADGFVCSLMPARSRAHKESLTWWVGYTSKYPTLLHHRGSSIKALPSKVGCNDGFFRLSDSILIDDGCKRFSLKRSNGKIAIALSPMELAMFYGGIGTFRRTRVLPSEPS